VLGTFTDVSANAGIRDTGFTAALGHVDCDDDGWQDVYIANDFGPDPWGRPGRWRRAEMISRPVNLPAGAVPHGLVRVRDVEWPATPIDARATHT
jgi:hypothetical protein